jgi:tetratricopeptide (TPR) repeat protein
MSRAAAAALLVALLAGCSATGALSPAPTVEPIVLSEMAGRGDPARRASQRLVLDGLDEDEAARPAAALAQYERALQVDPTNPWAWLALARHEIDEGDPARALSFLDKAEALLRSDGTDPLRVEPHLVGLRGEAFTALGRTREGLELLRRARASAPAVWSDGRLDAAELR